MLKRVLFLLVIGTLVFAAGGVHLKDLQAGNSVWVAVPTAARTVTTGLYELGDFVGMGAIRGLVILDSNRTVTGESTSHGFGANDSIKVVVMSIMGKDTTMIDSNFVKGKPCTVFVNYAGDEDPDSVNFGILAFRYTLVDSIQGTQTNRTRANFKWDLFLKE